MKTEPEKFEYCDCLTMFQHTKEKCTGNYKPLIMRKRELGSRVSTGYIPKVDEIVEVRGD